MSLFPTKNDILSARKFSKNLKENYDKVNLFGLPCDHSNVFCGCQYIPNQKLRDKTWRQIFAAAAEVAKKKRLKKEKVNPLPDYEI